jgi:hypothetical protein
MELVDSTLQSASEEQEAFRQLIVGQVLRVAGVGRPASVHTWGGTGWHVCVEMRAVNRWMGRWI